MATQTTLDFSGQADLARFNIPNTTPGAVRYGEVSRRLRALWRAGHRDEAAELAKVAGEVFKTQAWVQRYPAQEGSAAGAVLRNTKHAAAQKGGAA